MCCPFVCGADAAAVGLCVCDCVCAVSAGRAFVAVCAVAVVGAGAEEAATEVEPAVVVAAVAGGVETRFDSAAVLSVADAVAAVAEDTLADCGAVVDSETAAIVEAAAAELDTDTAADADADTETDVARWCWCWCSRRSSALRRSSTIRITSSLRCAALAEPCNTTHKINQERSIK